MKQRRELVLCSSCGIEFEKRVKDIAKVDSRIFFCSRSCKLAEHRIGGLISPPHYGTATTGPEVYWRIAEAHNPVECVDCGISARFALVVHHVDGDNTNQDPSNLEFVCSLHHAVRHMKLDKGAWRYDTKCLTPREAIDEINREIMAADYRDSSGVKKSESRQAFLSSEEGLCCPVCGVLVVKTNHQKKVSKSGIFCCSLGCKNILQRGRIRIEGVEALAHRFKDGVFSYRRRAIRLRDGCVDCGLCYKPLLVVHHINGDRSDGSDRNLEVLCFLHHTVRHVMGGSSGGLVYCPSALTPREKIPEILNLIEVV